MEETYYYMKGRSLWTYEYMFRDANYWHDSVKNKNNGENGESSTGVCVKEENDENLVMSNVTIKQEEDEDAFRESEKEQQPTTSHVEDIEEELKIESSLGLEQNENCK